MPSPPASFDLYGDETPASPIVLSVPHAGRDYPLAMRAALRVQPSQLLLLEDRHADTLALAARTRESAIVQRRPRAWIDLNRSEQERDPAIDSGVQRSSVPMTSARLRSGLGLVPRRAGAVNDIWRRKLDGEEVQARIEQDHRPYHARLSALLAAAQARFGVAVLLDIHSMPPLASGGAKLVIGDRFGRTAPARLIARIEAEAVAGDVPSALNAPYSGGYVIETHARPEAGIHAIQLEFDRSLYLDAALAEPGAGLAATAALLRGIITAVADEALSGALPLAAE
ncbi:N-formylglutamate amidohydrolase [Sphingomonas immobilis]|uniref:N-formylglutamate amidohydrolase n=1 Tax=Sphingomonas immobilis TaxID=3063997 RepID=A0ABT8ZY62_9SPHN|nr:N-formylglutamate amidohydrolase [Sphingomonas sp. CA1-15]MDO7842515.1 N-formylglutamate amidohydrolase [Sphingomonas sp. CA1-15]